MSRRNITSATGHLWLFLGDRAKLATCDDLCQADQKGRSQVRQPIGGQSLQWTAHLPQFEPPRVVTITLSIVAGIIDAYTYLALFGLFVAQVTGSFVIIGTGLVTGSASAIALLAVPVFLPAGSWRRVQQLSRKRSAVRLLR
jgi:hypothetical protein